MCATIVDFGLFLEFAVKLAPSFGRMNYWSPNKSSFPQDKYRLVGAGMRDVHRVNDYHEVAAETDIWIVPDVFMAGLQADYEAQGKLVWGSRYGDELELHRADAKKHFKKIGLDVGPWELVTGTADLRKYLKEHPDVYVKADDGNCRGDFETFHSVNYNLIEPRLDRVEQELGIRKHKFAFVVEDAIKADQEPGYDGLCVLGQFPKRTMAGCEVKDLAYAGIVVNYEKLPDSLREINDKLAPTLKKYGYRNFMSTEAKEVGGKAYVLDMTMRAGSPPSEAYMNNMTNLAEVIVEGAKGNLVEPIYEHKYAFHCFIYSSWAEEKHWQPIKFPAKYRDNIKLRNFMKQDGEYYVIPASQHPGGLGAIVSCSNDREECKDEICQIAKTVEGYGITIETENLDKADKELIKLISTFKKAE